MQRVFLDTCVLYPAHLRDTLLRLAEADLVQPLWSAEVLAELRRNLCLRHAGDESAGKVDRLISTLNGFFADAMVEGYEELVERMENHPKDRHVLAAALQGNADVLLTFNLKDFAVRPIGEGFPELCHPDAFLLDVLDLAPGEVLRLLYKQVAEHKRPPKRIQGLLDVLDRSGVPGFAAEVRRRLD
ncbi:putative nucleic acid-binding protein [Nocardia tenerifensis]|uniref:Putative nucleic acid-binding protein n=1 Tax=Nocardia tenerifensis TaxID=228006 RepID=A0A318K4G3_9NOCA|nr:PIN domain-containing protein [Nocardia tenerifensis]PXX64000.1 putative nucleic acid-binding protein [Nocardia tenerifensis]